MQDTTVLTIIYLHLYTENDQHVFLHNVQSITNNCFLTQYSMREGTRIQFASWLHLVIIFIYSVKLFQKDFDFDRIRGGKKKLNSEPTSYALSTEIFIIIIIIIIQLRSRWLQAFSSCNSPSWDYH